MQLPTICGKPLGECTSNAAGGTGNDSSFSNRIDPRRKLQYKTSVKTQVKNFAPNLERREDSNLCTGLLSDVDLIVLRVLLAISYEVSNTALECRAILLI